MNENKYKHEDTPRPKVYNLKSTIKVVITDEVLEQIRYLCNKIYNVEWSGVVFYDIDGDVHNTKNLTITLKYIYLMHEGNGGSTEYMFDEELVGFRMDNAPEALKWSIGHIHSHHNMTAYFSSTDEDEMKLNSAFHNAYLSIIVNNKLDIVGRLGFRGKVEETVYVCKRIDGKNYRLNVDSKQSTMFLCDAEIFRPVININKSFIERLEFIKKKKEDADEKRNKELIRVNSDFIKNKLVTKSKFPPKKQIPESTDLRKRNVANMYDYGYYSQNEMDNEMDRYNVDFEIDDEFDETQFVSFWVLAGELGAEDIMLDDALEQLDAKLITEADELEHVTMILNIATELYSRYFIGYDQFKIVDMFMDVYSELETRLGMFSCIQPMIQGLSVYLSELRSVKEDVL